MKKATVITLITCLILSCGAYAEPLAITGSDTIDTILTAQKGKAGDDLTGIVGEVNKEVVQLRELTGKEYYDAVVVLKGIEAVIIRTHE